MSDRATTLPETAKDRKTYPIASGVLDYFPDAIAAIAHVSYVGNEQHNPGQPLHWAREKSTDQDDTLMRHFLERGKLDTDGLRHTAKLAWRALALLQLEIEAEQNTKQRVFVGQPGTVITYKHVCGCEDEDRTGCVVHKTGLHFEVNRFDHYYPLAPRPGGAF
jgi:dATP/dGTP diphosphohydrolase